MKQSELPIFQIKLTLKNVKPPIWRRLLVPGGLSLHEFHWDIQRAMGWQNCHLYQFNIDGVNFSVPYEDVELPVKSSETVSLARFVKNKKFRFLYEYDFLSNRVDWYLPFPRLLMPINTILISSLSLVDGVDI